MITTKYVKWAVLTAFISLGLILPLLSPAMEEELKLEGLIELDYPGTQAKVEVNLTGNIISIAGKIIKNEKPEIAELLADINAIRLRIYDKESLGEKGYEGVMAFYEEQLKSERVVLKKKWETIAQIREKDSRVSVYLLTDGNIISGSVVLVGEPEEVIVVNIAGKIDFTKLSEIAELNRIFPPMMQRFGGGIGERLPNIHANIGPEVRPEPLKLDPNDKTVSPETAWHVIGPFENADNTGLTAAYPPETEINLSASYQGKAGEVVWKKADDGQINGWLNFLPMFTPNEWVLAYALIDVISPDNKNAQLHIGSDDGVKVWFNGEVVWTNQVPRSLALDEDLVPVKLKKGTNRLLFKVDQGIGDWGLVLRITDEKGQPFEDLEYVPARF